MRSGKDRTTLVKPREETQDDEFNMVESQDSIPGTPPCKKFKSMFFSNVSGRSKMYMKEQSNKSVILAQDSDEESD